MNLDSGELIAAHTRCHGKSRVQRNNDHYRDHRPHEADLEQAIVDCLGASLGRRLCARLRASMPRHYKDQLAGAVRVLKAQTALDLAQIEPWLARPGFTAGQLKKRLEAARQARARGRDPAQAVSPTVGAMPLDLSAYAQLGPSSGQPEGTHGTA